jgi:hypothetical protein
MREAAYELDRDATLRRFRHHLARTREILEGHAQGAMAEARGKVRRAATILSQRLKADATFQVEVEALDRLRKHVWPPMDWPSPLAPSENPKPPTRKARKTHAKK